MCLNVLYPLFRFVYFCLFTMISVKLSDLHPVETADPARICAQIISGMGFLGAGTIYKSNNYI